MIIETKYSVGETVWDCIRNERQKIIGINIMIGKQCCSSDPETNDTLYYLDNHLCATFRREHELERI